MCRLLESTRFPNSERGPTKPFPLLGRSDHLSLVSRQNRSQPSCRPQWHRGTSIHGHKSSPTLRCDRLPLCLQIDARGPLRCRSSPNGQHLGLERREGGGGRGSWSVQVNTDVCQEGLGATPRESSVSLVPRPTCVIRTLEDSLAPRLRSPAFYHTHLGSGAWK